MTGISGINSSTFRERQGLVVPLVIWMVLTPLAALTGPFETYQLLPLLPRLAYWATVVGASVLVDAAYRWVFRKRPLALRVLGRLGFAIVLGALVHGLNVMVFHGWMGWADWLWLVGVVWVIAIAVEGLVALSRIVHLTDAPSPASPPAADAAFQQRLPFDKRGALVRLEAQDHYLKVVTSAGEALILQRLSDAMTELSEFDGLRVHRSHWVAIDQVQKATRRDGRLILLLSDGAEVPVSRTYKAEVENAGLRP